MSYKQQVCQVTLQLADLYTVGVNIKVVMATLLWQHYTKYLQEFSRIHHEHLKYTNL